MLLQALNVVSYVGQTRSLPRSSDRRLMTRHLVITRMDWGSAAIGKKKPAHELNTSLTRHDRDVLSVSASEMWSQHAICYRVSLSQRRPVC